MSEYRHLGDDLDEYLATLSEEERERVEGASTSLDVARLIYRAREYRAKTQSQAAESSGFRQQTISRLESGTANATFRTVEKYLRGLQMAMQISLFDRITGHRVESVNINWDERDDSKHNAWLTWSNLLEERSSEYLSVAVRLLNTPESQLMQKFAEASTVLFASANVTERTVRAEPIVGLEDFATNTSDSVGAAATSQLAAA